MSRPLYVPPECHVLPDRKGYCTIGIIQCRDDWSFICCPRCGAVWGWEHHPADRVANWWGS